MNSTKKIRVLIIDDSIFFRNALKRALENDYKIEIVANCRDAFEAEAAIAKTNPDVIACDVELPGLRGPEFVKKIMSENPLPILLISSNNISPFEALNSGAVDFVRKPEMNNPNEFVRFTSELKDKIKVAAVANVKKITNPTKDLPCGSLPCCKGLEDKIIVIGASTGGTEAIAAVLKQLSIDTPGIVIVQHMPPGFTKMYAERLNKTCRITVSEARNGDKVQCGTALIAPGDKHITIVKDLSGGYHVKCSSGEKVSGHRPSVDVLFKSAVKAAGSNAVGVILTGMGKDGAEGLLEMRKSGAYTIGQDEASSVVYGMPMAAYDIGAVVKRLPLTLIARNIIKNVTESK